MSPSGSKAASVKSGKDTEGGSFPFLPGEADSPTLLPIPYLDLRWMHAGTQHLSLLPNPITTASTTYKAFSQSESERIEDRWESMTEDERQLAMREWGQGEGEGAPKKEKKEKDKTKEKEKEAAKKEVSANEMAHPVDGHVGSGDTTEKNPGEEVKEVDLERRYKEIVASSQKDHENLETVQGVPVSQVCPSLPNNEKVYL